MWTQVARLIIRFRLYLLIVLGLITATMAYLAQDVQMAYDFAKVVPDDDPEMIVYKKFKATFGEDGNIMAIGIKDSSLYELDNFNKLTELRKNLLATEGVDKVISVHQLPVLVKNNEMRRFDAEPLFKDKPQTQAELDSILGVLNTTKLYDGQFINQENGTMLMLLAINNDFLNSKKRIQLVWDLMEMGNAFGAELDTKIHYAGLPYLRSVLAGKVKAELEKFLVYSILVTAFILFLFFRSFSPMFYSLILIGMVVVWTMGYLVIFDFRMTMITGLLPPILVVIGIPNCIYLLNKYHQEFAKHGNKVKALSNVIRKIGVVTLITNTTTAIGFAVLTSSSISIMREFGTLATVSIMSTFVISIIFIPAVFSYLPNPQSRHVRHLEFRPVKKLLQIFQILVDQYRPAVYAVTIVLVIASIIGATRIQALTYMVDDLPQDSEIMQDLIFFEDNFTGVMPLELVVDMGKERGASSPKNLKKIDKLETYLDSIPEVTRPISMISFIKAANQAFFNSPSRYRFPSSRERTFVLSYLENQGTDSTGLVKSFVDSTGQQLRISMKVADIGSLKLDSLVRHTMQPRINQILEGSGLKAQLTGTTLIYIKGNDYLIDNLRTSMMIAFVLIAIIMATLFRNLRMIIVSLIPNMIPLLMTAGLMGYFGISLKPSTALVFSIAFGISVDDSIHFLAKYRQELQAYNFNVVKAVEVSLKETGMSMIYTSIVLFFGFVTFVASEFGGTTSLGALTSTTLLIAMVTNLVLLPCLLRSFDTGKRRPLKGALANDLEEDGSSAKVMAGD